MKSLILILSSLLLPYLVLINNSVIYAQPRANHQIVIQNNSGLNFTEKVVGIPWEDILKKWADIDTASLIAVDEANKQLPLQFETKGTGEIQNLLIQVSVPAKTTIQLSLKSGKRTKSQQKLIAGLCPSAMMILHGKTIKLHSECTEKPWNLLLPMH